MEDEDEEDEHDADEEMEDADESDEEEEDEEDADEIEEDPLEIPDPSVILAAKRAHPLFSRLFRSKGEYWLATRPGRAGEWSQAGAMLTLAGGRPWFVCIDRSEWETGNQDIDELVEHDLAAGGKWGDRRQELVFIGENLDIPGIEATLDACLLTDEEWRSWQNVMLKGPGGPNKMEKAEQAAKEKKLADLFDDGFPDWDEPEEEGDEMDHDHHGHSHNGHSHPHMNGNGAVKSMKPKHGIRKDGTTY
jgi:G3E family GTPase